MATKIVRKSKAEEPAVEAPPAPSKEETTEKKERAPRQDYGFRKGATIVLGEEKTYRGKRAQIYDILKKLDGKPVEKFLDAAKATLEDESARAWLKFFVTDSAASLTGGQDPEDEDEEEAEEPAPKAKGRKAK